MSFNINVTFGATPGLMSVLERLSARAAAATQEECPCSAHKATENQLSCGGNTDTPEEVMNENTAVSEPSARAPQIATAQEAPAEAPQETSTEEAPAREAEVKEEPVRAAATKERYAAVRALAMKWLGAQGSAGREDRNAAFNAVLKDFKAKNLPNLPSEGLDAMEAVINSWKA